MSKISIEDLRRVLELIPNNESIDYHQWFAVGQLVCKGREGDRIGFELWNNWSKQNSLYTSSTTIREYEGIRILLGFNSSNSRMTEKGDQELKEKHPRHQLFEQEL